MESTQSVLFIRVYLFQKKMIFRHCTRAYITVLLFECHYCILTCGHMLCFLIEVSYTWRFFRLLNGAFVYLQWRMWSYNDLWYHEPHMSWVYQPCFLLFDTYSNLGWLTWISLFASLLVSLSVWLSFPQASCAFMYVIKTPMILSTLMFVCVFPCLVFNSMMSVLVSNTCFLFVFLYMSFYCILFSPTTPSFSLSVSLSFSLSLLLSLSRTKLQKLARQENRITKRKLSPPRKL